MTSRFLFVITKLSADKNKHTKGSDTVQIKLLNDYIEVHSINKTRMAEALGISRNALAMKLEGKTPFKDFELKQMKKFLNLTDQQFLDFLGI